MGKGYLLLANGLVFEGERFGAEEAFNAEGHFAAGELVSATGMVGHTQTLTDPGHYGQIVVQTFPLIGSCGLIPAEFESEKAHLSAYIVHEICETPSNFRSEGTLNAWLKAQGVPGLQGIDVRRLARILREEGAMNAAITSSLDLTDGQRGALRRFPIIHAVQAVTCNTAYTQGEGRPVALYDFGAKASLRTALLQRGCRLTTLPADTPAEEALALRPAGIVLSGGPADPFDNPDIIRQLRVLAASGVPLLGIGLGHQMLAMACGARTHGMKNGHRGAGQPVRHLPSGRVYITSQNHGYCVSENNLPAGLVPLFESTNDGSNEGLLYTDFPGFSLQFHPGSGSGPAGTGFLFDQFVNMMEEVAAHAAG